MSFKVFCLKNVFKQVLKLFFTEKNVFNELKIFYQKDFLKVFLSEKTFFNDFYSFLPKNNVFLKF